MKNFIYLSVQITMLVKIMTTVIKNNTKHTLTVRTKLEVQQIAARFSKKMILLEKGLIKDTSEHLDGSISYPSPKPTEMLNLLILQL